MNVSNGNAVVLKSKKRRKVRERQWLELVSQRMVFTAVYKTQPWVTAVKWGKGKKDQRKRIGRGNSRERNTYD